MTSFRTDLAHEAFSHIGENTGCPGLSLDVRTVGGFEITDVSVLDERGAKRLGKPVGRYITLSFECGLYRGSDRFTDCVNTLASLLTQVLHPSVNGTYLVACLGNPDVTPDALGSLTASGLIVTRHLKQSRREDFIGFSSVSVCRPGVLGTSGIESAEHIAALCSLLRPDAVIAIDALAGSDASALCRCIQLSDTGIAPGSGVGNCREALTSEILGCPVFSAGVPTVVDAGAFSDDAALKGQFVCPRSIDSDVRLVSDIISKALNLALHPGISFDDIQMLVG